MRQGKGWGSAKISARRCPAPPAVSEKISVEEEWEEVEVSTGTETLICRVKKHVSRATSNGKLNLHVTRELRVV